MRILLISNYPNHCGPVNDVRGTPFFIIDEWCLVIRGNSAGEKVRCVFLQVSPVSSDPVPPLLSYDVIQDGRWELAKSRGLWGVKQGHYLDPCYRVTIIVSRTLPWWRIGSLFLTLAVVWGHWYHVDWSSCSYGGSGWQNRKYMYTGNC